MKKLTLPLRSPIQTIQYLLLAAAVLFSVMTMSGQYRNTDARYIRDNLEYFTSCQEKAGFGKTVKTHGLFALPYPQAFAMYKLYREENEWVNAYVISRLTIRDVTGKAYIDNDRTSPYEALSKLVTDTNSQEMKNYYDLFLLDQAQLSGKTNVTDAEVNAWQQERKEYVQRAQQSWQIVFAHMVFDLFLCAASFLPALILALVRFARFLFHTIRNKSMRSATCRTTCCTTGKRRKIDGKGNNLFYGDRH